MWVFDIPLDADIDDSRHSDNPFQAWSRAAIRAIEANVGPNNTMSSRHPTLRTTDHPTDNPHPLISNLPTQSCSTPSSRDPPYIDDVCVSRRRGAYVYSVIHQVSSPIAHSYDLFNTTQRASPGVTTRIYAPRDDEASAHIHASNAYK
ncbi:hypothetical protein EW146_g1779 [Bondarzewia mesenterica]|uniref:Uncharacterized protein n=1 Tax=Bondarzewia mesenterica TaxID=1095465 RepID=A0A4S4M2L5_9AGAM|nr:hypothetical protein EW146_g1779 [Bondarzewia mesenterica]